MDISEIYNKHKTEDRDSRVQEAISLYMKQNVNMLSDGIISNIPKISSQVRDNFGKYYNISDDSWSKRSNELKLMKSVATVVNIGLLMSYFDTKNKLYLMFLFLLSYSRMIPKYFKNGGYDSALMKYTIDGADNRTDFKKYGSIIVVIDKKVDTFISNYNKTTLAKPTDKNIGLLLQAVDTRMSDVMKNIADKYYKNFKDPNIKIMMQYKDENGGSELSSGSVMEAIREKSLNKMLEVNQNVLAAIGLGQQNMKKFRSRNCLIKTFPDLYPEYIRLVNVVLDEYLSRYKTSALKDFKKKFMLMRNSRGMTEKNNTLDVAMDKIKNRTDYNFNVVDQADMRNYIFYYVLTVIYMEGINLLK